jgi:hypothetical protein
LLHYLFEMARIRIRIKQSDPDPYQIEMQDPDPVRNKSEKQDPDPDQKGLDPQHCMLQVFTPCRIGGRLTSYNVT